MMQKKDRLYNTFLRSRHQSKLSCLKKFRNELTPQVRKAKSSYSKQIFKDVPKQRPEVVWKNINEFLNRNQVFSRRGELTIDGQAMLGTTLAECFSNYFSSTHETTNNDDAISFGKRLDDTFFF